MESQQVPSLQAVLVVAENLFMSQGKIASQCAHAAVGLYKVMIANQVPWYEAFEVRSSRPETGAGLARRSLRSVGRADSLLSHT